MKLLSILLALMLPAAPAALAGPLGPSSFTDCNENGIEDSIDIATGVSSDADLDGVPDECQEGSAIAGWRFSV